MAHYDCGNCGYTMGIAYGSCENCTPDWVFEAKKEIKEKRREAREKSQYEFEELYDELLGRIDERYEELIAEAEKEYNLTYAAGKDWWREKVKGNI